MISVKNGNAVTYTVPQKIRKDNVEKSVEIFFRVNNVYHDMLIKVMSGDTMIASFKREHMAPGEMEKITLPKVILDRATTADIVIALEKQ